MAQDNLARIFTDKSESRASSQGGKGTESKNASVGSQEGRFTEKLEKPASSQTRDNRHKWTIASRYFDREFRDRITKAAKWSNMSQADYIYRTLSQSAETVLKDRDNRAVTDTLPVALKERTDKLEETIKVQGEQMTILVEQIKTLAEDSRRSAQIEVLAEQVRMLTEEGKKGFWKRIFS